MWVQPKEHRIVGAALALARERAGLTQKQVARKLRKPQSFVSNYERGQRRIDLLELLQIVGALEADPRTMLTAILASLAAKGRGR